MKKIILALFAVLVTAAAFAQSPVPATYFGNHVLHDNWSTGLTYGSVRTWDAGVTWNNLEPSNGSYNWGPLDAFLTGAQNAGINDIIYTFGYPPSWAAPSTCNAPYNMADLDNFVSALLTHANGRIKHFEIWNEPELSNFYCGSMTDLATIGQHIYRDVKAVNSSFTVHTPAPAWADANFMSSYLQAGGLGYADVVDFHWYAFSCSPEGVNNAVDTIRGVMNNNGIGNKPLWITEGGWGQTSDCSDLGSQSDFVARYYLMAWSKGLAQFNWYSLDDSIWGLLCNISGYTCSGLDQPGIAYNQVEKWMVGATMTAPCAADASGTWSCGLSRSGYSALAMWNPGSYVSFTPPSQYTDYRDIYGNQKAVSGAVSVGPSPLLFESTSTAPAPAPAGAVTVSSPTNGATISSPVNFVASATGGSYPITAMRIYVDDNAAYTVAAASLNTSLTLTTGPHALVIQAWNSAGQVFKQSLNITVAAATTTSVTISAPINGSTVSSPAQFTASATGGTYPVTAMRIYVDSNAAYTVNAASLNTSLTLTPGTHQIAVVAWNSQGQAFTKNEGVTVPTATTTSGSVTVTSPTGGATVNSPVHFVASASSPNTITAMRIYIDNNSAYTVNAASLDTSLTLATGTHYVVIQAWDTTGAVFKNSFSLSVATTTVSNIYTTGFNSASQWYTSTMEMSDGALNSSGDQIEPYYSNIAAIGLVRDASKYPAVLGWLKWYIAHLNYPDQWGLNGSIYVYNTTSTGAEINTGTADSTDSYAGTFLTLLYQAYQTGDPNLQSYIKTQYAAIDTVAQVLIQTQHPNGLTWAKPNYNIEYLMDNCEAYRGLRDVAALFQAAFGDGTKASYYNQHADMMYNGIQKMWMGSAGWSWYTDDIGTMQAPNWGTWYPDATAEVFPVLEGVVPGSDPKSQQVWNQFNAAWPGWTNLSFNSQDSFPWVLVGDSAAAMGDKTRLAAYVNTITNKYINAGYPAPWNAEENGFWMRATSYMFGWPW